MVRRRYLARYQVEGEAVTWAGRLEAGTDGWIGVTTFQGRSDDYLQVTRQGIRLYRCEE
jgi:hypothetical protein